MRIVGILLVITGGVLVGVYFLSQLKKREGILSDMILSLNILLNEISFERRAFDDVFTRLGRIESDVGLFYRRCADELKTIPRMSLDEIWEKNAAILFSQIIFAAREREVIITLGRELGISDHTSQMRSISYALKELTEVEKDARESINKKSRMYVGLSLALSVVLLILAL